MALSHRWEVRLGVNFAIPFRRGVYRVCIRQIMITAGFVEAPREHFLHICSDPGPMNSRLWIDNEYCLNVLTVLPINNVNKLFCTYPINDLEYYTIDLGINPNFRVYATNSKGVKLPVSGRCVLEFIEVSV